MAVKGQMIYGYNGTTTDAPAFQNPHQPILYAPGSPLPRVPASRVMFSVSHTSHLTLVRVLMAADRNTRGQ